jgi:hypothetical protein
MIKFYLLINCSTKRLESWTFSTKFEEISNQMQICSFISHEKRLFYYFLFWYNSSRNRFHYSLCETIVRHNFQILLFWYLIAVFTIRKISLIITIGGVAEDSTIYYLKLRFQRLNNQFDRIWANNLISLNQLIIAHNRVPIITKDCNTFFTILFAIVYFNDPLLMNLAIFTIVNGNLMTYIKIIGSILIILCVIGLYLITCLLAQLSTEVIDVIILLIQLMREIKLHLRPNWRILLDIQII